MKHRALAAGLVALLGVGVVGCKSTSQMAWWKPKGKDAAAIANTAPTSPADAARKAAGQPGAAQLAGGDATPYVPPQPSKTTLATSGPGFPSTSAPPFKPDLAGQVGANPSATVAQQAGSTNLGSIANPYDPANPPASRVAASVPAAPVADSRYGNTLLANTSATSGAGQASSGAAAAHTASAGAASAPAYTPTTGTQYAEQAAAAPGAIAGLADRYGTAAVDAAKHTTASVAAAGSQAAATGYSAVDQAAQGAASAVTGSRYSDVAIPAVSSASQIASTVPVAPVVAASAQSYRPGGTSSYPGTTSIAGTSTAVPQVAARVQSTTTTPYSYGAVPNAAAPASAQPATPARY